MYGNVSSICGHLPTPWPGLPQEKHTIVVQSLRAGPGRDREAGTGIPGSRRCSKVSIPVISVWGGGVGVGAGAPYSRRSSKMYIYVGIGWGGGVCTGEVGSKRLSNASRPGVDHHIRILSNVPQFPGIQMT